MAPHLDKVSLHRIITYYVSTKQKAKITLINANLHISRFLQGSYPNSDVERLQTQCFKSVWVATALHQVRNGKRKNLIKKPLWSRSYFPTTGFDIPAQLWSPDGSTQHSPRGGRCSKCNDKHNSSLELPSRWFIGPLEPSSIGLDSSHSGEMLSRLIVHEDHCMYCIQNT